MLVGKKRKTHSEFTQEVFELVGDEYEVISQYKLAKENITMRHNVCETEFVIRANNFLNGTRCKSCFRNTRRKTHQEYVNEVKQINPQLKVIGVYVNSTTKILHECECELKWEASPNDILNGGGNCFRCGRLKASVTSRKSNEEFSLEVEALTKGEFKVLGEYTKNNVKIQMQHLECSHNFHVRPNSFLLKPRCPKCSKKKTWSYELVKEFIEQESNSGCELISETFINAKSLLNIKCPCNTSFNVSFHRFKDRHIRLCGLCRNKIRNSNYCTNHTEAEELLKLKCGDSIVFSEEFKGMNKKHWFYCKAHKKKFLKNFNQLLTRNSHCPECGNKRTADYLRKSHEDFLITLSEKKLDREYEILTEYTGNRNHIEIKHKKCGKVWSTSPGSLINGGCPYCTQSSGEKIIEEFLYQKDILFKKEYTNIKCKDKGRLRFDFAVYVDSEIKLLIEFDGLQHFASGFDEEKSRDRVRKDRIKNSFAISESIPLLRIPFWEKDNSITILCDILFDLGFNVHEDELFEKYEYYIVDKHWNHDDYIEMSRPYLREKELAKILSNVRKEEIVCTN